MADTKEPRRFWIDKIRYTAICHEPDRLDAHEYIEAIEASWANARIRELEAQIKTVVKINLKLEAALERES